ncbi:PBSX family phage terminase large subunit [Pukyongiella litopenaei]|uniref:Uncharacterized protein n=1 Tax=Pukyongiella litopenaei TaxID=2605946 RepID=A0A2S0MN42_9RHOB|nr:phage terminase large subunit [Pukyongiella litopenaei]AVO37308.1 hypothetical protein C6Y53_06010 [Pukyongiella litopenaei]
MMYYAPWGDERLPATYLERHAAKCRALQVPYETHPTTVATLSHPEAEAAAAAAAAAVPEMFAYNPPDGVHLDPLGQIANPAFEHLAAFGGRGGSKSHRAAEAIIEAASVGRERVAGAREFMQRIKESSKELLDAKARESRWAADWESTDYELRNTRTGSVVFFIGLTGYNADSVGKALEGVSILWTDEAQLLSQRSLDIVLPTIRAAGSRCVWTWNPGEEPSPVDQLFRGDHPPERSLVGLMQVDGNPYLYRTRLAAEMRASFKRDSREKFNHIWRGAYLALSEATIFHHVSHGYLDWDQHPQVEELGGMDFGYGGPDPSAAVLAYLIQPHERPDYVPEQTRALLYVAKEAVERSVPNHRLSELPERCGLDRVIADSAMPLMIDAINAAGRVAAYPAKKGPGSELAGLRKLQSCDILISPDCPTAAEEFKALRWAVDPKTNKVRLPRKSVGEDHVVAALRYAMSEIEVSEEYESVVYI